jgi:8-oxo-dGTP diphosphatase
VTGCRARVVIVDGGRLALIKRVRSGQTYFLFPGGGVHEGETPEQAAAREAREELGIDVSVGDLLHEEIFDGERFLYFAATIDGGQFGSGSGDEIVTSGETDAGTYEPVWLPLEGLADVQIGLDVRPRELVDRLATSEAERASLSSRNLE